MLLPNNFKSIIENTFYDKKIVILSSSKSVDNEGGVSIKPTTNVLNSFKGNVRYVNLREVQEEYGLTYQIDMAITTNFSNVYINNLISYNNIIYVVTDVIPTDSHFLIVAVKYGKN